MKPLPQMMPVPALEALEKEMSDLLSNITDIRKEGREDMLWVLIILKMSKYSLFYKVTMW